MVELVRGFQEPDSASKGLWWIQKDPSDKKDYKRDLAAPNDAGETFLDLTNGEAIASVLWIVHDNDWNVLTTWNGSAWSSPPTSSLVGSTSPAPANDTSTATVWLEAGTVEMKYLVTARVTTSAGRIADESFQVRMVQR